MESRALKYPCSVRWNSTLLHTVCWGHENAVAVHERARLTQGYGSQGRGEKCPRSDNKAHRLQAQVWDVYLPPQRSVFHLVRAKIVSFPEKCYFSSVFGGPWVHELGEGSDSCRWHYLASQGLPACLTDCMTACLPAWLPDWLHDWLPACLPDCLTACLTAWLPDCLSVNI